MERFSVVLDGLGQIIAGRLLKACLTPNAPECGSDE